MWFLRYAAAVAAWAVWGVWAAPELAVEGGCLTGRGAVFRAEEATLVATAAHVLLENPDLMLRDDSGHAFPIRVLEFAPDRDLVLLEADLCL